MSTNEEESVTGIQLDEVDTLYLLRGLGLLFTEQLKDTDYGAFERAYEVFTKVFGALQRLR